MIWLNNVIMIIMIINMINNNDSNDINDKWVIIDDNNISNDD